MGEEKSVRIGVSLDSDFLIAFEEAIRDQGMTRSEAIRSAMRLLMEKLKKGR